MMGITTDQLTRCHLNRLQRHYAEMKAREKDVRAREEFELHAWAFARVLINSEYLKHLLCFLVEAHECHKSIWDLDAETPDDGCEARPIWALELAELILKAANLMYCAEPARNQEFYGAFDALRMIEEWTPFGAQSNQVFLALLPEDYEKWAASYWNPHCWLGFPTFLQGL